MATTAPAVVPTVAEAAAAFLTTCTAASTRRSYTQTMKRLTATHGPAPVTTVDAAALQKLLAAHWDGAAPATWNRHLATLGSFTTYAVRRRWLEVDPATGLQRRKEIVDRTRSIDAGALQRLFDLPDVRLRDRTPWRMLYETAARAEEILTLALQLLDTAGVLRGRRGRQHGGQLWLDVEVELPDEQGELYPDQRPESAEG